MTLEIRWCFSLYQYNFCEPAPTLAQCNDVENIPMS